MRLTMRQKLVIGLWMTVLLIGVVAIAAYVTHQHSIAIQTIRERVERLHEATLTLQVAVLQVLMPPNDYLIHARPEERIVFERGVADVHTRLQQLEALVGVEGSDPRFFKEIRTRFERFTAIARDIFALSSPVGDRDAALRMEGMDHLAKQIITDLNRLHAQHTTFLQDKQQIIQQAERRTMIVMIACGSGAIIMSLLFGMLLFRSLMYPITNLIAGLRQIAGGDLAHRIPVTTDDEIGTIACEVNAMVEKLEASHGEFLVAHQKLREAYDNLIQADKMASLGLMAGTVVHDIANPLTVILGEVQVFQMEEEIDQQRIEAHCRLIEQYARRINHLLQNIRAFARKSGGELQPTDVEQPIEDALILVGKVLSTHKVDVIRDYASDLPPVMADPIRLEQVFMNLLQNAAQAMADGGTITITTRRHPLLEVEEQKSRGAGR